MKPKLSLLHGWAVNSNIWNPIVDRLESEFEITIIDLPGYGNDRDYTGDYSLEAVVDVVLSRAPERSNWVGWSLGATIAMAAANKHPGRFEKLQLVSATPHFLKSADWEHGANLGQFQKIANDFTKDHPRALRKFLLLSTLSPERVKARATSKLVRAIQATLDLSAPPINRNLKEGLRILESTDLRSQLGEIAVETQVVAGKNDHVVSVESSRWLFEQLNNGHSFHVLDAGHLPFLQADSEYIETLVSFIKNSER